MDKQKVVFVHYHYKIRFPPHVHFYWEMRKRNSARQGKRAVPYRPPRSFFMLAKQ